MDAIQVAILSASTTLLDKTLEALADNRTSSVSGLANGTGVHKGKSIAMNTVQSLNKENNAECIVVVYQNLSDFRMLPDLLQDNTKPVIVVGRRNGNVSLEDGIRFSKLIHALRFIERPGSDTHFKETLFDTIFRHLCHGDTFFMPFVSSKICDYPDSDEFREFVRIFSVGLRTGCDGISERDILKVMNSMWKDAPAELKIQIKRSLKPASLYVDRRISVPFKPELDCR